MKTGTTENAVCVPKNNRWYLCKESNKQFHWECELQENFDPQLLLTHNPRIVAIPVSRILPSVFDFMIINNALKQTFEVKK